MRCAEAIQGLTDPAGRDSAALAEHLEHCPRCAARARREAQLDRLWEATRPEEPAPAVWATVWAQVTQALEAGPAAAPPRVVPLAEARPWRRRAWVSFGIAQAAALLVAAWLVSRPDVARPPGARPGAGTGTALARKLPPPGPGGRAPDGPTTLALATNPPGTTVGPEIEIDDGSLVVIRSDGAGVKVVSNATDEGSSAVDANFLMLNYFEAMAE